jgi:hypothetical protein
MLNVGLDFHGVIDSNPELFSKLSKSIVNSKGQIHVITGQRDTVGFRAELRKLKISWTQIHSITDFNAARGVKIIYKGPDNPWMDQRAWNSAKARICKEHGIDVHFDDSCVYGNWFKKLKVKTVYIQIKN